MLNHKSLRRKQAITDRILLSLDLTGSHFIFVFSFRHVVCHRRCSSGPTAACTISATKRHDRPHS